MIKRAEIKERARSAFQSCYWPSVGLFAIFSIVAGSVGAGVSFSGSGASGVGNLGSIAENAGKSVLPPGVYLAFALIGILVSCIGLAYAIFVSGPLSVSSSKAGLGIYDGNRANFKDVIYCFTGGRYGKCVGGMALYSLFTALACFVIMIPLAIIAIVIDVMAAEVWGLSEGAVIAICVLGGLIAGIGSSVPAVIVSEGLSLTPYLIADEGLSGMNAIRRSWEIMRGHKWERFVLELSFLGWGILNALTCGILGVFYVNPYVNVTYAGYYRELTGEAAETV